MYISVSDAYHWGPQFEIYNQFMDLRMQLDFSAYIIIIALDWNQRN